MFAPGHYSNDLFSLEPSCTYPGCFNQAAIAEAHRQDQGAKVSVFTKRNMTDSARRKVLRLEKKRARELEDYEDEEFDQEEVDVKPTRMKRSSQHESSDDGLDESSDETSNGRRMDSDEDESDHEHFDHSDSGKGRKERCAPPPHEGGKDGKGRGAPAPRHDDSGRHYDDVRDDLIEGGASPVDAHNAATQAARRARARGEADREQQERQQQQAILDSAAVRKEVQLALRQIQKLIADGFECAGHSFIGMPVQHPAKGGDCVIVAVNFQRDLLALLNDETHEVMPTQPQMPPAAVTIVPSTPAHPNSCKTTNLDLSIGRVL